ncbi:uncharacterized protein LOC126797110 [Argentina anserina]|uniref:uncharacterized protein LOC126797110 n=1 Tax=Argentina anserina TaxID=57926 RepID=UPI0021761F2F|nr:uncharacterized protein LOC126797110 [Potentilla anserina]
MPMTRTMPDLTYWTWVKIWKRRQEGSVTMDVTRSVTASVIGSVTEGVTTSVIGSVTAYVTGSVIAAVIDSVIADTDRESVPIVESAIPETRENVPIFYSTSTECTPTPPPPVCNVNSTMVNEQPDVVSETLEDTYFDVVILHIKGVLFGLRTSLGSKNRGNCVELIKHTSKFSPEVAKVVLQNAPKNAYTSPTIQKEILNILANKVRMHIRGEVGDSSFCILVDEAQDSTHKEQMAIILRFFDKEGFLRERFFDIVMVVDTIAKTLHQEISKVLLHHNLQVERLRGQGYNWSWLQLQEKVDPIWKFFSSLSSIVNVICASPKRHTEFHVAQVMHITELVIAGERGTCRGLNQIGTLHRPGATRWGSHFTSVCDLIDKYDATCTILEFIMDDKTTESLRAEADGAYNAIRSFHFIFILHLLKKVMGLIDILCQKLQQKSQDILNAMNLVEITVNSLHKLREDGWEDFLEKVVSFCRKHDIDIPDMDGQFNMSSRRRNCQQRLCQGLFETKKSMTYQMIDRLIRLVLTLPVSTGTTERSFSTIKRIKTMLRNKMENDFLADNMIVHIEKELAENYDADSIITEFASIQERRVQFD